MARLSLTLKLHDAVFDVAVVGLRDGIRLGDGAGAAAPFVGADWVVRRTATGWMLGDWPLEPGVPIANTAGGITVVAEWLEEADVWWMHRPGPNLVPLMFTAALVLWASAHDTVMAVLHADPALAEEVAALFLPGLGDASDAAVDAPAVDAWPPAVGYLERDTDAP